MRARLQNKSCHRIAVLLAAVLPLSACVTYLTPGPGAPMQALESDTQANHQRRPEAPFPSRISVVRVQAAGYRSFGADGITSGNYSVVTTREVETNGDFDAVGLWPQVLGVEPLSRLLLPVSMQSFDDLRAAAAATGTDILFVYTFDTHFHIENQTYQPEQLITLGVLPGREASVSSTAAGAFIDVRSGFLYGSTEGSGVSRALMTKWTKPSAADETRLQAERTAFAAMMDDARHKWSDLIAHYGQPLMTLPDAGLESLPPELTPAVSTAATAANAAGTP